jgi:DNA-binding beta-propeller fold protein YncE
MVRIEAIKSSLGICSAVLVLSAAFGCSKDNGVAPDRTYKLAPGSVTDLSVSDTTESSVTLTWTAPGDDGMKGTASQYDLRYSTNDITNDTEFNAGTKVSGLPSPGEPGTVDTAVVTGLAEHTTYYFALKTRDEAFHWSALSNVARARTLAVIPRFVLAWGSAGTGDGQFDWPIGIAVDRSGYVYVSDLGSEWRGFCGVQKFTGDGVFITKWGSHGTGDGQFSAPSGVTVDGSGNVYVADALWDRIQKFDGSGTFLATWGSYGSGFGEFDIALDVASDGGAMIYVVDQGNARIQKFDRNGTFNKWWGSWGSGDGQFNNPSGVAVDKSGNVYVADAGNNRIQKFDWRGEFLTKWGSPGSSDGQFKNPCSIAVDANDNVYVLDSDNNRIQKFDGNGVYLTKWGSPGSGDGQFDRPSDIAMDGNNNIYVVDRHRVQKFR